MFLRIALTAVVFAGALPLAACGTAPADLDLTLQHPSRQGKFIVRMEPPATGPALQQLHAWQIHLTTAQGAPVSQASIAFDGGMPRHGHGFPTRPRVTRERAPGVYDLEGVKFSMTGWWDMKLDIRAGDAADSATFNVVVDAAGLKR
ncbi:MAG: FixH family protein [Piscinibacter sp.]|nr:FixH family protein [Piscinibacter sp.]